MKKRIYVGKRDIAKGIPADPNCCPIAVATKRTLGAQSVVVGRLIIASKAGHRIAVRRTGRSIVRRMNQFDDGNGMDPFSFTIEVNEGTDNA